MLATKFVSTMEAAEIIDCDERHVRWLLKNGNLKGMKLNQRAWAVDFESVEEYKKHYRPTGRRATANG